MMCAQVNVDAQLADSAALAFTKAFYLALAVGSTVQVGVAADIMGHAWLCSCRTGRQAVTINNEHMVCHASTPALRDGQRLTSSSMPAAPLPPQNAFDIGKQAVAAAPNVVNSHVEGEKFLLLPEGQDHNVAVFAPRPVLGPPPRWQPDSAWTAR